MLISSILCSSLQLQPILLRHTIDPALPHGIPFLALPHDISFIGFRTLWHDVDIPALPHDVNIT